MGCFPQRPRNQQQQKQSNKIHQSLPTLQHTQHILTQNQQHQISILINKLYTILASNQINASDKNNKFLQLLQPSQINSIKISQYFIRLLKNQCKNNQVQNQNIKKCISVSYKIVSDTKYYKFYAKIDVKQLDSWGDFLMTIQNNQIIDFTVRFMDEMFLKHKYKCYGNSQKLFKAIVYKFSELTSDQLKVLASTLLVQMMKFNENLLKFANSPYIFLQFLLYQINQQPNLQMQLYWIQSVKILYFQDSKAEDYLFYENDFRAFIDLLVRVMGQCPDGKTLKIPLECYLVLCNTKLMQIKRLRIDDIKQFIMVIDAKQLGIENQFKKICELQ